MIPGIVDDYPEKHRSLKIILLLKILLRNKRKIKFEFNKVNDVTLILVGIFPSSQDAQKRHN